MTLKEPYQQYEGRWLINNPPGAAPNVFPGVFMINYKRHDEYRSFFDCIMINTMDYRGRLYLDEDFRHPVTFGEYTPTKEDFKESVRCIFEKRTK